MSPQHNYYSSDNGPGNLFCSIEPNLLAISVISMHSIDPKFSIAALVAGDMDMTQCGQRSNATTTQYGLNLNTENQEDDYRNYCSDDSELSVGNETNDTTSDTTTFVKRSLNHQRQDCTSSAFDQIYYQTKLPDIIRPSLARQEEYLRRSQIYTGEILKQHLNLMSVTKGLNVSPKMIDSPLNHSIKSIAGNHLTNTTLTNPLKIGLSRLQVYAGDLDLEPKWKVIDDRCQSQSPTNFREIHSHLNAITQITSALGTETSGTRSHITSSPPDRSVSRENSESPLSTTNPSIIHNVLHNNFNDSNLKFSIDNILKPNFGCRITDPLHKLSAKTQRKFDQQRNCGERIERITKLDDAMLQSTM